MPKQLNLGGYAVDRNVLAQRYRRGEQDIFLVALPLNLVESYLPVPDPTEPFEGNRRVNLSRAIKFGEYWRKNAEWVAPPLLVDTTFKLSDSFASELESGGVELGILTFPQDSKQQLNILDGQHRILGMVEAQKSLYAEQRNYEEELQIHDSEVTRNKLEKVRKLIERSNKECITIEIIEGISSATHKQFFHDIAVNAKGINKAVVAGFDQKLKANRIAVNVSETNDLLSGNTEYESDRVSGGNPNLVSLKTNVDIVNEIVFGITKRIPPKDDKISEQALESVVNGFFDLLVVCFEDLDKVSTGELTPSELRGKSLLGSATILRHLANAYGEIAVDKSNLENLSTTVPGLEKCKKLFLELSANMNFPVSKKWMSTGYFPAGAKAPGSRAQELKGLSELIVKWGKTEDYWTK
jgi:hypothetical protein